MWTRAGPAGRECSRRRGRCPRGPRRPPDRMPVPSESPMSESALRQSRTNNTAGAGSPAAAEDPRVSAILQEYLSDLEAGRRPDRAALLARHAELAPTLAEAMDGLDFLYGVVPTGGRKPL